MTCVEATSTADAYYYRLAKYGNFKGFVEKKTAIDDGVPVSNTVTEVYCNCCDIAVDMLMTLISSSSLFISLKHRLKMLTFYSFKNGTKVISPSANVTAVTFALTYF